MRSGSPLRGLLRALGLAAALTATAPRPAVAQAFQETRLLREAAARESRGDFAGAEAVLRRLLRRNAASSGGLFALERVLRAQGRTRDVLPVADTFLAAEPRSAGVRFLKMRILLELDSLEAVRSEGEAWLAFDGGRLEPYREVARVWERAFGAEEARAVLMRGRRAVGNPDALAMEVGDLLASSGDTHGAVEEWARAVGDDGSQATAVARRAAALAGGAGEAGRKLVALLAASPEPGRRRAGVSVALELGLEKEARSLAEGVAGDLSGRSRASFLSDVARRARDRGLAGLAAWAYAALGEDAVTPGERRRIDERLVDLALARGDTATALEAARRIVSTFTPGSVDRRKAEARVVAFTLVTEGEGEASTLLQDFREAYPGAPELDELASAVAARLLAEGDAEGAAALLAGVEGPRSSLERGYLLLEQGDVALGRQALLMAVAGLAPEDATDVIDFAGALGRASPAGVAVLVRAAVAEHRGAGSEAAALLRAAADSASDEDALLLLARAATVAERADEGAVAAAARARLVERYAGTAEAAEAALRLARYRADVEGDTAAAVRLLEDLIVRAPDSAVVPVARRELARLRAGRGGTP